MKAGWVNESRVLKAGTHRPNRWTSEAFGETRTRSVTNVFSVFSCVGSFRSRADVVSSDGACEVWGGGLSDVWATGFSDRLCASWMAVLISGVLVNQRGVWEGRILCALCFSMHSVPSFPVFMFCSTGLRIVSMSIQDQLICVCLVMPHCMFSMQLFLSEIVKFCFKEKVTRVACISLVYNSQHKRHPLIASCASAECTCYCAAGSASKWCVSMQLLCRTGQTRGNRAVGEWSDKGAGHLGGVWGALRTLLGHSHPNVRTLPPQCKDTPHT